MALLELIDTKPNWFDALGVALTLPPGVPERREGEDPMAPPAEGRPRRIADDLAWLRQAIDEPEDFGLRHLSDTAAVEAWESGSDEPLVRLLRLRDRGVLEAGGFLLHEFGGSVPPVGE